MMEMQMFHVNEKYLIDGKIPNMTEAMKKSGNASDTFAVLAILVNLQQPENSDVTKLFDSFTHVRAKNENYVIGKLFPLSHLLPRNTESFYRYNGSLSFPNCREVAIWTVFKVQFDKKKVGKKLGPNSLFFRIDCTSLKPKDNKFMLFLQ